MSDIPKFETKPQKEEDWQQKIGALDRAFKAMSRSSDNDIQPANEEPTQRWIRK